MGISLLAENLLASQEELYSMDIVTSLVSKFCYKSLEPSVNAQMGTIMLNQQVRHVECQCCEVVALVTLFWVVKL